MPIRYLMLISLLNVGYVPLLLGQADSLFVSGERLSVPADHIGRDTLQASLPEAGLLIIDGHLARMQDYSTNGYSSQIRYQTEKSSDNKYVYFPNIFRTNWLQPSAAVARFGKKAEHGALVIKTRNHVLDHGFKMDLTIRQGWMQALRAAKAGLPTVQRKELFGQGHLQRYQLNGEYRTRLHKLFSHISWIQESGPVRGLKHDHFYAKIHYSWQMAPKLKLEALGEARTGRQSGAFGELFIPGPATGTIWGRGSALTGTSLNNRALEVKDQSDRSHVSLRWNPFENLQSSSRIFSSGNRQQVSHRLEWGHRDSLQVLDGRTGLRDVGIQEHLDWNSGPNKWKLHYQGIRHFWQGKALEELQYNWNEQLAGIEGYREFGDIWDLSGSFSWMSSSHLSRPFWAWTAGSRLTLTELPRTQWYPVSLFSIQATYDRKGQDPLAARPDLASGGGLFIPVWGWPWLNPGQEAIVGQDLDWEVMNQLNLKMNMLFQSKWVDEINIELYRKQVNGLSGIGGVEGEQPQLQNLGNVQTEGLEIQSDLGFGYHASWLDRIRISVSGMRTKVLSTQNDLPVNLYAGAAPLAEAFRMIAGDPLGGIYGYQTDGLYQPGDNFALEPSKQVGDIRLLDRNEDGKISPDDRALLGQSLPAWTASMYAFSRLDRWTVDLGISSSMGHQILRYHELERLQPGESRPTDQLVQSAASFRIRKLEIGYEIPHHTDPRHSLRVTLSGENLFLLTSYRGFDPDINSALYLAGPLAAVDYGALPGSRLILAGVKYRFR